MGELKQVDEGLPPEVAALARALRDLFAGLKVSTRRYAARRSYDSSTVSRYLSGRRLPPWEFVRDLLHDVAEERGSVPTPETIGMLRELHSAALRSGGSPVHHVQLLQRKLAEADEEARRAALRERVLEESLQDREHRIRDLQMRHQELQAASMPAPGEGWDGARNAGDADDEHARLRAEIHDLQDELDRVRSLHREAEERCAQLEHQLMDAERSAERAESGVLVPRARGARAEDLRDGASENAASYRTVVHGDVYMQTSGWQVDEEYVEALTVTVLTESRRQWGNGLLISADLVVTMVWVLMEADGAVGPGTRARVLHDGQAREAEVVEVLEPNPTDEGNAVVALRLLEAVTHPARPVTLDLRQTPGNQVLVSGQTSAGHYTSLVDVRGRTGRSLRVSGEIDRDVGGAPVFSLTGGLVGLVAGWDMDKDRGHILSADVLRSLRSVPASTWAD
ncbi:hypothetical protein ACN2WE_19560 [Streptomyces sp. cg28]|uniref:hypothetical protein n=1 Tax=Streptomyces sp. cg28 TaxID=3403457 RepID=UPI003B20F1AF